MLYIYFKASGHGQCGDHANNKRIKHLNCYPWHWIDD